METVADFIFLGSKITADGDCSHEINIRCLLLGRKVMTNLDSRDITLLTDLLKSRDIYNRKKTTSLTSGAGKTGQPLVKE